MRVRGRVDNGGLTLPSLALTAAKSYLEKQVFLNLASQIPQTSGSVARGLGLNGDKSQRRQRWERCELLSEKIPPAANCTC